MSKSALPELQRAARRGRGLGPLERLPGNAAAQPPDRAPLRANTSLILTCSHISGDLVKMRILVQGSYEFCDSAGLINSQEEADSAGPGPHSKEQLERLSLGEWF